MTQCKIANLSVNGKKHWPAIGAWLRATRPDLVTFQKIGRAEHFPEQDLRGLGYEFSALPWRSRSDAGVAVLTREGLGRLEVCVRHLPGAESDESRFLTVRVVDDLWVCSIYAPYGLPPHDEHRSKPPHERAIADSFVVNSPSQPPWCRIPGHAYTDTADPCRRMYARGRGD